jgi:hypothetical protein
MSDYGIQKKRKDDDNLTVRDDQEDWTMQNDEILGGMMESFPGCGTNKKIGKRFGIGFPLYEFKVAVLNVSSGLHDVASRTAFNTSKRKETQNVTLTWTIFHFPRVGLEISVGAGIPRGTFFWGLPVLHFSRVREDRAATGGI